MGKPPVLTPAPTSLRFRAPGVNKDNAVMLESGVLQWEWRGDRLCACSRVPWRHPSPPQPVAGGCPSSHCDNLGLWCFVTPLHP